MLFYWPEKRRQVRVEGAVKKISAEDSLKYFSSRPRENRIGAWASNQSSPVPERDYIEKRFSEFKMKFRGKYVPLPPPWGGYRIIPSSFEFWQEGRYRLHDRILYSFSADSWKISRLSP
jgi:pyridoxamine 5'-phosphate oxidase